MKKSIVTILLFLCIFLVGSTRVEPTTAISTCSLEQCRNDCWWRESKCLSRCRKAYPDIGADRRDCVRDCQSLTKQCYRRCENDCR